MNHAIDLQHVSKAFAGRPAVVDLTLAVPRGSIFGLLGHNGAGKSTTLGMLLGQVFPDAGVVTVNGHDVFRHRAAALGKVGAIFEGPAFYDYLSGLRNLRIFCEYTARVDERRLREVVELVGLGDRIKHKAGTYSHGMRQRLAIAQALLPGPDLLILDEPSDGLDPQGIADMRDLVRRLHHEMGITILFSSHLLHEVEQLCSHVAVMHMGRLVFNGKLSEVQTDAGHIALTCDHQAEAEALLMEAGLIAGRAPGGKLRLAGTAEPADVNRLLVQRGYRVTAIGPARLSLEDFYLALVGNSTSGAPHAADTQAAAPRGAAAATGAQSSEVGR